MSEVLFRIHQSVTLSLCFSLWGKHGGHFLGFSHRMLIDINWSCRVVGGLELSVAQSLRLTKCQLFLLCQSHGHDQSRAARLWCSSELCSISLLPTGYVLFLLPMPRFQQFALFQVNENGYSVKKIKHHLLSWFLWSFKADGPWAGVGNNYEVLLWGIFVFIVIDQTWKRLIVAVSVFFCVFSFTGHTSS